MPRPDKKSAEHGALLEDTGLLLASMADDLDVELSAIARAHARDTQRRRREVARLAAQRDELRRRADEHRRARAWLPGGQDWTVTA